jgi:hypothetical protein
MNWYSIYTVLGRVREQDLLKDLIRNFNGLSCAVLHCYSQLLLRSAWNWCYHFFVFALLTLS